MGTNLFGNLARVLKLKKRAKSPDDGYALHIKCPTSFSLVQLRSATNDFCITKVIGSDGYGKVYKAMLDDGQMVAIKRAERGSMLWKAGFTSEIELLSRLRHNNVLDLIGFCVENGERILVYDYIPNGSLKDILFGNTEIQLDWGSRVSIALQSARALAYLHNDANPRVIHRDVKPANILVDENLTAKVAHLGLAKILDEGNSHVTTLIAGTMGYLDPEYIMTGQLSVKSDVYSLGIVLLQLITRRPAFASDSSDCRFINELVKATIDSGGIRALKEELMDPLLTYSPLVGFEQFLSLVLTCVEKLGSQRPSMREMVKELESILDMQMEIETETGAFSESSPPPEMETERGGLSGSSPPPRPPEMETERGGLSGSSPPPRSDTFHNDIHESSFIEDAEANMPHDRGTDEW